MGKADGPPPFPMLPEQIAILGHYFYVYVFVATLPHTQAFHRARGISDEVSRLSLADLGRNVAMYRRRFDVGGFNDPNWIGLPFPGLMYALGRLQFERSKLGNRTGRAVAAAGLPYGPGDAVLAVHIPAFYGPITPEACDASFARAKEFFARHFPETTYAIATCHSWLLDEQLAEYLPEHSNIIRFQQRFRQAYRPDDDDEAIIHFVFRRTLRDLAQLPQRNSMERAVVAHIRSGRHWHGGAGWLEL